MKHARSDYDRIQDPEGKIPEDEPVFLLRACDPAAVPTLDAYLRITIENPNHDPKIARSVAQQIERIVSWQRTYGTKVAADMPADAVVKD